MAFAPIESWEQFRQAPAAEVARLAPPTMIFAAGGTRRAAALAGIPLGEEFARWSRIQMLEQFERCFALGARHLIAPSARPQMFAEQGLYRERVFQWMRWALAGPESLAFYAERGWRVRFIVAGPPHPELDGLAAALDDAAPPSAADDRPTLWYTATASNEELWAWQGAAFANGARTRAEAARALYGAAIPPATLLISFGKPLLGPDLVPPLLVDELQCYWTQKPGYSLDDADLRAILYDYLFLRATWREDKTGRAEAAAAHASQWRHAPTLGLGARLGPFWYPAPSAPAAEREAPL